MMEKIGLKLFSLEITQSDLLWQYSRFKTFKRWPFKSASKCLAVTMAAAGWYCTSANADDPSAKCPFCFKELNGWERTDDPWEEHSKHSSDCEFVKIGKQENQMTPAEKNSLIQARMLKIMELQYLEDVKQLEAIREKILQEVKTRSEMVSNLSTKENGETEL